MSLKPLYQYPKFWLPAIYSREQGKWVHTPNRSSSNRVICALCKGKVHHLASTSWKPAFRHMLNKHWLISMPYLDRGFTQIEEGQVEEATGPDVIVHMGLNALDVEALKFVLSQVEDGVLEVPEEYIPTLNSILEGLRQLAEQTVR